MPDDRRGLFVTQRAPPGRVRVRRDQGGAGHLLVERFAGHPDLSTERRVADPEHPALLFEHRREVIEPQVHDRRRDERRPGLTPHGFQRQPGLPGECAHLGERRPGRRRAIVPEDRRH
jgi:hypothetical protein